MGKIRWFTQRTTGLIYWPIAIFGVPFLMAKIGQTLGLWPSIDSLYLSIPWLFWIVLVFTRGAFAAAWILIDIGFHNIGEDAGFFWFVPDGENGAASSRSSRPDPVDQSGYILSFTAVNIIMLAAAEFAIRVATWTNPPYLPLPTH